MEATFEAKSETYTGNNIISAINFFWLGFITYSIAYTISTSDAVNYIVCQLFQILGLFLIFPTAFILIKWKFDNNYLKVMFTMYILWTVTVVMRGFTFDYQSLKFMLFDATFGLLLYFAPFSLLFPRDLVYYKKVFNVIVILSIAYIAFDLMFMKQMLRPGRDLRSQAILEYFAQHLSIPSGLILLTYIYHSKKRVMIALSVIVLTFFLAAVRARRSLMFTSINILILSYFIYYYTHKIKILVFVVSILMISSVYLLGAKIYNENRNGLFGYITERLEENTRTGVEEYFYRDMKTVDWIIGRGINGGYYCPVIDTDTGSLSINRSVIETGFLEVILKGGIVSLGLLLLIAVPAVFKGIFYSNNILSKAAGIWIFLFLINLYPLTPISFNMSYLLVWLSIGICYSTKIRELPDDKITEILSR